MHRRKGECLKHGWAQGPNGMETLDPEKVSRLDTVIITYCTGKKFIMNLYKR